MKDDRLTPKPDLPGELEDIELMEKDLEKIYEEEFNRCTAAHEQEQEEKDNDRFR